MTDTYDVIVIGAGPAGEVAAGRTADAGLSTVIVESELVGGECSYWACMPSKALLRPYTVQQSASHTKGVKSVAIDAEAVLAHRDEVVSNFDDSGQLKWLENNKIALVRGNGRLAGERRVVVATQDGERVLLANQAVVIATGSAAATAPIPGIDEIQPWDSRDATSAKQVPARLAVIGAGAVAVEMAQAWASLGSQVTMLVRGERLLDKQEPFVGDLLHKAFEEQGIDVRYRVSATEVKGSPSAKVLTLDNGDTLEVDEYLLAIGRTPRTNGLGLETVGLLDNDGKPIEVDDYLRVRNVEGQWLYAIGDVNGRSLLTHMGKYQARQAAANIAGGSQQAWADNSVVPAVIFTEPQVTSVGFTEEQARAAGMAVRAVDFDLTGTAAGYLSGQSIGGARLVIDESRKVVVGATFVGAEVAELLHSATIAIAGEVPLDKLWHAIPSFPTLSEVWLKLMEEYGL